MALTAILCATVPSVDDPATPRGQLHFAGHALMEYQARQAAEAGAQLVIALVDAVTPSLSRMVDRMAEDGIKLRLMRDIPTLMRDLPRDADILLFTDGAIAEQRHIDALAACPANAVLVTEDVGATPHLERIDGMHRWCGIARLSAATTLGTFDLIGDWDLSLTLLRAAVQADAKRITIPIDDLMDGRAALVDRQATADLVAQAIMARGAREEDGHAGAEHYLFGPLARFIGQRLVRMQGTTAQARIAAIVLMGLAIGLLYPGWHSISIVVMVLALLLALAADEMNRMARRADAERRWKLAVMLLFLLGLVGIGWWCGAGETMAYAAALAGIIQVHVDQRRGQVSRKWAYFTPGTALLCVGAGVIAGLPGGFVALAMVLAVLSVGWLLVGEDAA